MTNLVATLGRGLLADIEAIGEAAQDPRGIRHILAAVGVEPPQQLEPEAIAGLAAILQAVAAIRPLLENEDPGLAEAGAALDGLRSLMAAVRSTGRGDGSVYPDLGADLINIVVVNRIRTSPIAFQTAVALGAIEAHLLPTLSRGTEIVRQSTPVDRLAPERLGEILAHPIDALLRDLPESPLATTENANATADILVARFGGLLTALGLTWSYGWEPGDEAVLGDLAPDLARTFAIFVPESMLKDADAALCIALSPADEDDLGIVLAPSGAMNFSTQAGAWSIETEVSARVQAIAFGGGEGFQSLPDSGAGGLDASVTAALEAPEEGPAFAIGESEGTRLELGAPKFVARLNLAADRTVVGFSLDTGAGAFVLKPGSADGFLASLLPAEGLRADFELGIDWSNHGGVAFRGSAGLDLRLPVGVSLGGVTLSDFHLRLGVREGEVYGEASLTLSATLGPVRAVIDRIGIAAELTFPEDGGSLGVADLDIDFKWPSGIGMVVEAAGVATGGGFLFYDAPRSLYAGVLELSLSEMFTLKAIGLITTKMPDGSSGFTLVIFITAEDFQPIQLGMGFTLNGIGGMLAINRTFDENALREGMQTGLLASIMFPRDPVANAPAIINALTVAFPARRGAYLFGILVKIGWFTPTLVAFDLALILELGARRRLLVLGRVSALLPSADNDLVRLNLESMGVIDFDEGTVALDAVLVDSRLVHKFVLTGAMALRARWSDGPGSSFVLAVGGLNPRFAPPTGLPTLVRIGIALSSGDNPRITCAAYFAITANTLQFGARAELYAAAYGFSIQGDIGFDVLIQYRPLHFIADFHASVQLKRGSSSLFKVTVDGALEGPRPLRVSGKASFEICWCDFSIPFDKTLVEGEPPPPPPAIDVLAALREALADQQSWDARSETSHGVVLRSGSKGDVLIVDPVGRLVVRQQVVPLNTDRDVDLFGGAPVSGARRFSLAAMLNGAQLEATAVRELFAPSQYFDLTDDEKLTGPSFEEMDAGIAVGDTAIAFAAAEIVPAPLTYDSIVIDAPGQAPPADSGFTLEAGALHLLAETGAAARAPVRQVGRARFRDAAVAPAVTMHAPEYRIVSVDDRAPIAAPVTARSWSEQSATLATLNREGVRWQLVPAHELVA